MPHTIKQIRTLTKIFKIILFSLLIGVLLTGSLFFTTAQSAMNPISLGIIAVDKNGQRTSTRTVNSEEFIFDGTLTDSDAIRYQFSGIDLALRYLDIAADGGGFLRVYNGEVNEGNFILNAGRENYPLLISELSPALKPGQNTLKFVYKHSGTNRTYRPVSFTFDYSPAIPPANIKIISPANLSVFAEGLENTIVLELENFSLTNKNEISKASGKLLIYYNQINPDNKLGSLTSSQESGQNKYRVEITENQVDFSQIPDSEEVELIFVLADSQKNPIGIEERLTIRTNFNNSIDTGLPSVKILEPRKDRSDLTITPDTKFILQVENFNVLTEIRELSPEEILNNNEGYLQILVDQGNFTIPLETTWPRLDFTLRELGYVPQENSNPEDIIGGKTVKVQLVNIEFEPLQPEAKDQVEIFYEPEIVTPEDGTVIENNIWRLVMISFTIILIIGVIIVLVLKG